MQGLHAPQQALPPPPPSAYLGLMHSLPAMQPQDWSGPAFNAVGLQPGSDPFSLSQGLSMMPASVQFQQQAATDAAQQQQMQQQMQQQQRHLLMQQQQLLQQQQQLPVQAGLALQQQQQVQFQQQQILMPLMQPQQPLKVESLQPQQQPGQLLAVAGAAQSHEAAHLQEADAWLDDQAGHPQAVVETQPSPTKALQRCVITVQAPIRFVGLSLMAGRWWLWCVVRDGNMLVLHEGERG